MINLLERTAARFDEEEENRCSGSEIAACKDVAVAVVDSASNEWREKGQHEVPWERLLVLEHMDMWDESDLQNQLALVAIAIDKAR